MSSSEAWAKGVLDGYQSTKPGVVPATPAVPAEYPATLALEEVEDYFHRLGYERGAVMAHEADW